MIGIEQPVEMDDEVAHLCIVDGLLRLCLPGGIGGGVVGIDADDVELVEILEGDVLEIDEFAADHEVKQLLRGIIWHGETFLNKVPGKLWDRSGAVIQGKGRFLKCPTMRA